MNKAAVQWNKSAIAYSEYVQSNKQTVFSRFFEMHGKRVLDLGCGYGGYTEYFRNIGAEAIGVDDSMDIISIAQEKYPDGDYRIADITEELPFDSDTFDLVFCNQVFTEIEDIAPVFSEVKRVLKSGGVFFFSIVHPAFYDGEWQADEKGYKYAEMIGAYRGEYHFIQTFWGATTHYHRPLSYYLNLASDNGFVLNHVEEPESYDGVRKNKDLPLFIFLEYTKPKEAKAGTSSVFLA